MSKYEVNDKFIIEIAEVCTTDRRKSTEEEHTLYRAKGFNSLVFDDNGLDKLQKCEELSNDSKEMLEMKVYSKGLNDVWEFVRKTGTVENREEAMKIIDFFGVENYRDIYRNFTPQEALAKLEAYEKKIEVGDVVRLKGSDKEYVVTTIDEDRCNEIYCGVSKDGRWFSQCNVEKTGKHIDIQSVLSQIAE